MFVLGIETSCDETAAAVVETTGVREKPWAIRSNIVASQTIHREWGGVVPELASRQHVRDLPGVVDRALEQAGTPWSAIDALAVTQGPGLVGALLVGVAYAKAAAVALEKPIVAVNHLAGHIESVFLDHGALPLPAAILVVSGGHTSLYFVPEEGVYQLVGRTRDDAAGEAYDKVAKLLGLGYPGGPAIDRVARTGNDQAVSLPRPRFSHPDRNERRRPLPNLPDGLTAYVDFSFSGLKTAVVRLLQERGVAAAAGAGPGDSSVMPPSDVADVAATFQRVVVETLIARTFETAQALGARSVGIAGGVSANSRLRKDVVAAGQAAGLPVFVPAMSLSTDNAAMIAAAGLRRLERGERSDLTFNAEASLPIALPAT